jgi:hypothetical protein
MSKRKSFQAGDSGKWETIRRLRYGDILKLFRHRWGTELPNDDSGRDDLWLLVTCVSLAAAEPKRKMRHVIEMWAPWMLAEERDAYVEHVWGLDIYERTLTGREMGERLGLTNAERETLKLWRFRPFDKTDEELGQLAKERERDRRASKRRQRGVKTRAEYLAEQKAMPTPWIDQGISRRTWERRRKVAADTTQEESEYQGSLSEGGSETTVLKHRTHLASPNMENFRKEGFHGGVELEQTVQKR